MRLGHQQRRTRSDAVAVKRLLCWQCFTLSLSLFSYFPGLFCGPKPTASLLVHLGTGRHAVYGHEEKLLGLDFAEQMVDVSEYGSKDLFLRYPEMSIWIVGMRTWSVL
jgi:hypothetical protein